ncbi:MAG TPA: TonB family protein [Candidatus Acidoferrum sp.]|nr:TonB family protein [Candidatus Acidoferrum sp.]
MSFSWKQYEGQVVNNAFPLQRYLGGSSESAVFLTQLAGPQSSKAAIKLVPESASTDLQLSLWRRASKLTHPNLLQLYQGGRCRLADMDLLYIVMEYAEEDLSQILPQRALTSAEARDMLGPVLDALSNLHAQGLVHSRLKPSNILATADQVKLSADRLFPAGEFRKSSAKRTAYDAPETASDALTPGSDVWSLGVLLIEVLTQRAPDSQARAPLQFAAESLAQPFRDIARHALEPDPQLRWTIATIEASLNPRAAAAVQGASRAAIPVSKAPAVPAAKPQVPRPAPNAPPPAPPIIQQPAASAAPAPLSPVIPTIGRGPLTSSLTAPKHTPLVPSLGVPPATKASGKIPPSFPLPPIAAVSAQKNAPRSAPKQPIVLPSYVIPIAVGLVVVGSIIALPKILGWRADTSSASTTAKTRAAAPQSHDQPADAKVSRGIKPNASSPGRDSSKSAAAKPSAKDVSHPSPSSPSPATLRTETKASPDVSKNSAASSASAPGASATSGKGEVLDQVLPDVSGKALATISGKVRVTVMAHVDASGNVSSADFENPGPSQYFADLAMKAMRRWEFNSAEVNGRSVPSQWLVRFEFTSSGVKVFPQQITP